MSDDEKKDGQAGDEQDSPEDAGDRDSPAPPEGEDRAEQHPPGDVPGDDGRDEDASVPEEPGDDGEDQPEDRMDVDEGDRDWQEDQGSGDEWDSDGWESEDWADESYNERDWQNPNWQDENWQDEHYVERQLDHRKGEQAEQEQGGDTSGGTTTAVATRKRDEDLDEEEDRGDGGPRMSLIEHLEELRKRLFWALVGLVLGMAVTIAFGKPIIDLFNRPYFSVMTELGMHDKLKAEKALSGISIYFTVCLVSGLIVSSPWVFYQIWKFVAAGLYRRERTYVMRAIPFSTLLFVAGALFFMLVVSYKIIYFLMAFNQWLSLEPIITQKTHIGFMVRMMIVFGLGFQIPLVVLVLTRVGLVSRKTIARFRRYIVVAIFVFAAVSTSPSPVDQILLALPMWVLFEIGLALAYFAEKKRLQEDEVFLDS